MVEQSGQRQWKADKGRRRSLRVLLTVTVIVRGKSPEGKDFEEEARTLVVNAHGALIALGNAVVPEQTITLTHKMTKTKLECRVVYLGPAQGGRTQVGIEFKKPSPSFWQISFPPEDWVVPES